jgi:O-antigen ligase
VISEPRSDPPVAARMRSTAILDDPTAALVSAGVLSALLVGVGLAADLAAGVAVLVALCFVPLVLVDLRLGVALWLPIMFFQGIPALNFGGEAAGLLIVAAWFGSLRSMRGEVVAVLRRHRRMVAALAGLIVWLALSVTWADDPGLAGTDLRRWIALGLLFVVVATTLTAAQSLRLVAYAFVAGAVMSVASGVLDGSLTSAVEGAARFEGGGSDPNFLAASIVAATVLAGALMLEGRSIPKRLLMLAAVAVLSAGLVVSASRGGALAAAVTVVAALVVFKRRRAAVLGAMAVLASFAALTFANAPAAWERVTNFDDDNGRSDLWYVAWAMAKDDPITGVGLGNFRVHSSDYVQETAGVNSVANIVETPHYVHNTYLQLLSEGGLVALALFVVVVVGCLRAYWRAAERFEAAGESSQATMARAALVATVSILAAAMFLSAALDMRLWLLLGLGPAMLAVASRSSAEAPRSAKFEADGAWELAPAGSRA